MYLIDLRELKIRSLTTRAMTQNPEVYPEPHIFRPERYLESELPDPRDTVFGFGRR